MDTPVPDDAERFQPRRGFRRLPDGGAAPDIVWGEAIPAGSYPRPQGFHTQFVALEQPDSAMLTLSAEFRLASFPLTNQHIAAFAHETKYHMAAWPSGPRQPNLAATRIYCSEIRPICRWLEARLKTAGLLGTDWMIDAPTIAEWGLGINALRSEPMQNLGDMLPSLGKTSYPYSDWCWANPSMHGALVDQQPASDANEWMWLTRHLALGMWFDYKNQFGMAVFGVVPTWDEHIGLRVVARRQ